MFAYDALVYAALVALVIVVGVGAWVVKNTPSADLEQGKVRFAAATFAGMLLLIVFIAVLYFVNPDGPGKDIFTTVFPALASIAAGIAGNLYGSRK
jgi:peptidoglycan/LPS O-acetylase OafA/YrhL